MSRPVRRPGDGEEPPAQNPEITAIEPPIAMPGAAVTLRGSAFGRHVPTSRVTFKLNAPDLPQVAAGILAWADDTVRVQVPALSALGAAGLASVQLSTAYGETTISFVVRDAQSPAIRSLVPASALPGTELRITGDHLGVAATPGQGVSFGDVMIPVIAWTRQQVRVSVPDPASVGGSGPQPVRVHSPWGVSAPVLFNIAEPPVITTVSPAVGPPDSAVMISGSGFGAFQDGVSAVELQGRAPGTGQLFVTRMELVSWAPNQIRAIVPGLAALKESGDKELIVVAPLARSAPGTFHLRDVGSVTSWTRIEPHTRTDDPEPGLRLGLRAELADPLWLLGRQWVLGELTGEDTGSPVTVRVDGEAAPLSRWRPGRDGVPADLPAGVPLEALVEREAVFPASGSSQPLADRRLAADTGLAFLRLLDRHVRPPAQAEIYRLQYSQRYPLAPVGDQERAACDPAALRFLALVAGRVPDGALLRASLQQALPPERGGAGRLPADPPVAAGDQAAVMAAVADWFSWCESLVSGSAAGETAWQAERLEYSFAVAAATSVGEVVLEAPEYAGGRLDWHAFRRGGGSLGAVRDGHQTPAPIALTMMPTPVSYRGMPAARWWELEDAAIDFGLVDAGPTDLARMLLIEFATVFGDDWFTVPVGGVPLGTLVRLTAVRITDTFGDEIIAAPFREIGSGGAFRLFQLTDPQDDRRDLLLLPDGVAGGHESAPLEEVAFFRDELANLAWAVERTVASPAGRPMSRQQASVQSPGLAPPAAPAPDDAGRAPQLSYQLMTPVPDYWIPFVPTLDGDSRRLARAALRRPLPDGSLTVIRPLGRILVPEAPALHLWDSEIPPEGIRVTRTWQLARGADGRAHLWLGRQRRGTTRESSSSLSFDVVHDPNQRSAGNSAR